MVMMILLTLFDECSIHPCMHHTMKMMDGLDGMVERQERKPKKEGLKKRETRSRSPSAILPSLPTTSSSNILLPWSDYHTTASMDTPVIDLTAAPDSPRRRNESAASSSSQEAPLVATSLTAARTAHSQDGRTVNAVAGGSGPSTRLPVLPARRRVPYPTNAASTPIDLTDDDIEYLGEHRLHLPDQPHVEGNDARPVAGDNYSLMGQYFFQSLCCLITTIST